MALIITFVEGHIAGDIVARKRQCLQPVLKIAEGNLRLEAVEVGENSEEPIERRRLTLR